MGKRFTRQRQHKIVSLIVAPFLLLLCVSGILLNSREAINDCEVSRGVLPPFYRYEKWNQGLLRGTAKIPGSDSIVVYGTGGLWVTDSRGMHFSDFNQGLPRAAGHRNFRAVVAAPDSALFAVSTENLYRRKGVAWEKVTLPLDEEEALSDLTLKGDTLVALSRNRLFLSAAPYSTFKAYTLKGLPGQDTGKASSFRTVWLLHSGQLFHTPGIIVADAIAVVFIILIITGWLIWLIPKRIRRVGHDRAASLAGKLRGSLRWHKRIGYVTLSLTLIITITGWSLRPPALIALAKTKLPVIPGSALDSPNPWQDKLRMVRHDGTRWIVSTSEGFIILPTPDAVPEKCPVQPPVSVMGLNVFQRNIDGSWLLGSFSGFYRWDVDSGAVTDYLTDLPAVKVSGAPFGKTAVAGFSRDFRGREVMTTYDEGTESLRQPAELSRLPMSLWNVALETHTGRIYFGNSSTYFLIFILGGIIIWSLITGYCGMRKHSKKIE